MDITIKQLLRSFTTFPKEFNFEDPSARVYFNEQKRTFYAAESDIPYSCDAVYEVDLQTFDTEFTGFKNTKCFSLRIASSGTVACEIRTYSRKPTSVFSLYTRVNKVEPKQTQLNIPVGFPVSLSYISPIGTVSPTTGVVELANDRGSGAEVLFVKRLTDNVIVPTELSTDTTVVALSVVQAEDHVLCLPPSIPIGEISGVLPVAMVYVRDTSKLSREVESAIISSTTLVLSPSPKATGGYSYVGLCDGSPPAGNNVKARLAHVDEVVPVKKFGGYINLYFEGSVFDFGNRTHKTIEGARGRADADRPVHQFVVIIGE